jgi:glycosyltransferase involved in cell wall biosynthesis
MKIAFLSLYYGKVNRGAETFVFELSQRLRKDHRVDVISGGSKPLASIPILWRFFLDPQGIGVLLFTLKNIGKIWKEKYQIVIPIDGGWEALLIRILTWSYGGKVVISGQSGKGWFDRINILSSPNSFVALSVWSLDKLKWMNPFVNSIYIPNGVDINSFKSEGEKFRSSLSHPVILAVGAFTTQKRLNLTIDAVSHLKDVSLLIAGGGGDLRREIKDYGIKKLKTRFRVLDLSYKDMPKVYRSADLFTLASKNSEAFGNVYLEAMASGLPVVAPNDPIRKEIIGDAGLLVDPRDTLEYSKVLRKALQTNWGSKPRKQAEKFSWDEIAKKYESLFLSLIKK